MRVYPAALSRAMEDQSRCRAPLEDLTWGRLVSACARRPLIIKSLKFDVSAQFASLMRHVCPSLSVSIGMQCWWLETLTFVLFVLGSVVDEG